MAPKTEPEIPPHENAAHVVAATDRDPDRAGGFPFLDPPSIAFALAERVIDALTALPPNASAHSTRAHVAGALIDPIGEVIDRVRRETILDGAERVAIAELRKLTRDFVSATEKRIAKHAQRDHDDQEHDDDESEPK